MPIREQCRHGGFSDATLSKWQAKFGARQATEAKLLSQLHVFLTPGELLTGEVQGECYSRMWQVARADSFEPYSEDATAKNKLCDADTFEPA